MEISTFRRFFRLSLPSEIYWYTKLVYVVIYFSSQTLLFLSIRLLTNLHISRWMANKYNIYNTKFAKDWGFQHIKQSRISKIKWPGH